MHKDIHYSTVRNCNILETTQMPSNKTVVEYLWYIYTIGYYTAVRK